MTLKYLFLAAGALAILLGGLWLLQGLGIVQVPPILCVADCAPLEGPSPTWAVAGFVTVCLGILAIVHAVRRMKGALRDSD